jgi:GT2 family glycosyltransferase/glycosyltransferase involved in cell wall biosynthesis
MTSGISAGRAPRTSVIVPTWNGEAVLRDCLVSISKLEQPPGGFELIVVDNGSSDGTELLLRREFPWARRVRSETNLGFARGCNLGMAAARGEYLVLLNNDTLPSPDWLRLLVERADEGVGGAVACKIVYAADRALINNAGSELDPRSDWPARDRGINEVDQGQYDAIAPSAFCGAAVLLKRDMLDDIGVFDEHFFMYWEDADLSWRANLKGWKVDFAPEAVVAHLHAASSGEMSSFFRYHVSRNRVLVLAKHGPGLNVASALGKAIGAFAVPAAQAGARGEARSAFRELALMGRLLMSLARCAPWALAVRVGLRHEKRLSPVAERRPVPDLAPPAGPRQLRIGIYNPYLGTMGGGERLTATIAEALCKDHQVEILTRSMHGVVSLAQLEERFGVTLTGAAVVDLDSEARGEASPRLARRAPAPGTVLQSARRRVADVRDYWLARRRGYDLFVNNQHWSLMRCPSPLGIYVCMFPRLAGREPVRRSADLRSLVLRATQTTEQVLVARPDEAMRTYSSVVAISDFTNHWLREWWGISGQVIYPPCKDWSQPGVAKRNIILSVGRFFARADDNHHKRHEVLLEAFSLLSLLHPDWELHLVGSRAPDAASVRYLDQLMADGRDLRVHFHVDATSTELGRLYSEARFYWHATGFGDDNGSHPQRQEHFGITTVEAMATGAVPVVFAGGGQPEIVTDGFDGVHWRTLRELVKRTSELIDDGPEWRRMSVRARLSAQRFSPERFSEQIVREVDRITASSQVPAGARSAQPHRLRPPREK